MSRRTFLQRVGVGLCGLGLVGFAFKATDNAGSEPDGSSSSEGSDTTRHVNTDTGGAGESGVYYLGPRGSDDDAGSEQNPWFSVTHAAQQVSPGDTIRVLDGTYNYGTQVQHVDGVTGTQSEPITLTAADGASPTFAWSGDAEGWEDTISEGLLVESSDWWVIDGLELRESHSAGLELKDSANCTLQNLEVHHNGGMGALHAFGTPNTHVRNCDAHHNGTQRTARTADGFVFNGASGDSTGTVVENTRSFANLEDGFDCWDGDGITFRRCSAFGNGRPDAETRASTAMGMGFKLGGGHRGGGNRVERCLAWGNHYTGFSDNVPAAGCTIVNCTAVDNGVTNFVCSHEGTTVLNCISHRGRIQFYDTSTQSNTWDLDIDDPEFETLDVSSPEYLHLAEGSPCVDAGVEVDVSYTGETPDLGAIETEG